LVLELAEYVGIHYPAAKAMIIISLSKPDDIKRAVDMGVKAFMRGRAKNSVYC